MSVKKIIYGFHSITSRIRLDSNSIKEIYLDESRNDARMSDLVRLIKANNINYHLSTKERLDGLISNSKHQGVIANIVENKQKTLKLGNIYSQRDWGHAKDYVYGMWLMLQQDKPDDYVLSTNQTTRVKDFIIKCFKYKDIELEWKGEGLNEVAINKNNGEIVVEIDEKYFRPSEVEYLLGYSKKAEDMLGWKATTNLESLIVDMFENSS